MKSISPMFNNLEETSELKLYQERKKPITKSEGRKERIDKLKDVRILLTPEQKKSIKKIAKNLDKYPTHFSTEILVFGINNLKEFKEINYIDSLKTNVCTKIRKADFDKLFDLSIEWDCSIRQAAHRVFFNSLIVKGYAK